VVTKKEIRVEMVFPIPGKWTIETREGGEFILTNETDQPATAYLELDGELYNPMKGAEEAE